MSSEIWERTGLLDGLSEEQKVIVSEFFDKAVEYIILKSEGHDNRYTILFTYIRKILCFAFNNNLELPNFEEIVNSLFGKEKLNMVDVTHYTGYLQIDVEAELTDLTCKAFLKRKYGEKIDYK